MNCDGVRGLISAFIDGELSAGELLRVEQHLRRCHCCADEVDALRQTIALVSSLDEVEVPTTFRAQLHERLVALGPPVAVPARPAAVASWQRNVRRWAVPAAAAAAAMAIGLTSLSNLQGELLPGLAVPESIMAELSSPPQPSVAVAEPGHENASPNEPDTGTSPNLTSEPVTSTENPGSPGEAANDAGPVTPARPDPTRSNTGAVAVTSPGPEVSTETPTVVLASLFTYTTLITGPVSDPEEIQTRLLKRFPSLIENGSSLTVTLSHSIWQQELPILEDLLGDNVVIETTPTDIARSIRTAQELQAQRKLELETFDQRLATLTAPADREQALRERAKLDQDLEAATESVLRLQEQVNMVIVTFQLTTTQR
jgi:hypothetical protein